MDFNIEVRRKQLENLNQLITSSADRLQSVLNFLEWTSEKVAKEDPLVPCPINAHHRILPKSWKDHVEKCLIKSGGYKLNEKFLSEPCDSVNSNQSISLDRNKKIEIITKELAEKGTLKLAWNGLDPDPITSDRLFSTFSTDERLIFYNYCIANTAGPPPPPEFITTYSKRHNEDKRLTSEERLAQERDAKRRRAKYRSVHINKKNHTEVIREVINNQMDDYQHWLASHEQQIKTKSVNDHNSSNNDTGGTNDRREGSERPSSSIGRNSNHSRRSRSRSRNRKYDYSRERRNYSRDRDKDRTTSKSDRSRRYNRDDKHHRSNDDRYKNSRRSPERRHNSKDRKSKSRREYDSARRH